MSPSTLFISREALRWRNGVACLVAIFALAFCLIGVVPNHAFAAIDEIEDNGSFETATPISMNQAVYGTIDRAGESDTADYFKVVLPQSGKVKLVFANDRYYSDGWNNRMGIDIFDKYYNPLGDTYFHFANVSTHNTQPQSFTLNLKKGANYFRVVPNWLGDSNHPYHFKLTYVVPGTTIGKTTPAKKAFTIKWTKKSGAAKYQIRYSAKKSMSGAKTVNVSKSTKSKKIKGLKSKKKYYVQVRVVKKIGGQTYYSNWSPRKTVKTK